MGEWFLRLRTFLPVKEVVPSRGENMWRRRARNTPPSLASSFGKYFFVFFVYMLSCFSVSNIRTSSFEPWTKSTRLTCFMRTACTKKDVFVLKDKVVERLTTHNAAFPKGIGR